MTAGEGQSSLAERAAASVSAYVLKSTLQEVIARAERLASNPHLTHDEQEWARVVLRKARAGAASADVLHGRLEESP